MPDKIILKNSALKRRLMLFVIVNALLVAVCLLVIYNYAQNTKDSQVINLAGRQRMLSQTIAKRVYLFNITGTDTLGYNNNMASFINVHNGLLNGKNEVGLKKVFEGQLKTDFNTIDSVFKIYITSANDIINKNYNTQQVYNNNLKLFKGADSVFLLKMNAFVFKLSDVTQQKRSHFLLIQIIFVVILIFMLLAIFCFEFLIRKLVRKNNQVAENIAFYAALQFINIAQEQHTNISKLMHDELAPNLLASLLYLKTINPTTQQAPYFTMATNTITDVVAHLKTHALQNHVNDNDFENFTFNEGVKMQCAVIDYALPNLNILVEDQVIDKTYKILLLNFIKDFLTKSKNLQQQNCDEITLQLLAGFYIITFTFGLNSFTIPNQALVLKCPKLNSLIVLLKGIFTHNIINNASMFTIKVPFKNMELNN